MSRISRVTHINDVNITHVLRIPFPPSNALLQLDKSLAQLRQDELLKAVPSYAHIPVSRMDIGVGVFDLRDPERLRVARETMGAFDFASSVGGAKATPLSVTLSGLSSGGSEDGKRPLTSRFLATIREAPWLDRLCDDLVAAFRNQGVNYKAMTDFPGGRSSLKVALVDIGFFRTQTLRKWRGKGKYRGQSSRIVRPKFEAGDIYARYANKVWVDNLPLDRICFSNTGLKDMIKNNEVVGTGWETILSRPLSGTPGMTLEPEDPEIKYVKSAERASASRVIMPLIVSSSTDPMDIDEHRRD